MSINEEQNQLIEIDSEMTQMMKLVDKLVIAVIIIHWIYLASKYIPLPCKTLQSVCSTILKLCLGSKISFHVFTMANHYPHMSILDPN